MDFTHDRAEKQPVDYNTTVEVPIKHTQSIRRIPGNRFMVKISLCDELQLYLSAMSRLDIALLSRYTPRWHTNAVMNKPSVITTKS